MGGDYDGATVLIEKIDNDDTKAMTVRAIGMALAIHQDLPDEKYNMMFSKLDVGSKKIEDSGARDIAYTYIAMAQAFAGLDDDATKTTVGMNNPAKHKPIAKQRKYKPNAVINRPWPVSMQWSTALKTRR